MKREEEDMQDSLEVEEGVMVKFPLVTFVTCLLPDIWIPLLNIFQAYRGAGRRQKSPLNGVTDFLSKTDSALQQSVFVSFNFCFAQEAQKCL